MNEEYEPEIIQIAELLTSLVNKRIAAQQAPKLSLVKDDELTVRQVAQLKNVSERTVRGWIEKKLLRTVRTPGGGVRILRSEIDKAA